jgi:starvation-inducible DNA-binding protein
MDIGTITSQGYREEIAAGLAKILSDTFSLYHRTHRFHWHIEGPTLQTLDLIFLEQYGEVRPAVEAIASRIRSLGFPTPRAHDNLAVLSSIWDGTGLPDQDRMLQLLADGHETVARTARAVFKLAAKEQDEQTCELMLQRMQIHDKTAWMLRNLMAWRER